jgi:ABC-2 type transport system ATP-binding protein
MSDRTVLEVRAVEKRFATVRAVDGISFDVRAGELFALLGPNGAGKTTLVRMLAGILRPDAGSIRYLLAGRSCDAPDPGALGYLPEERGLYRETEVLDTLAYFGVLRGMGRRAALAAAEAWLERFGLRDRARERVDALSKGNQQKVQLVAAILHGPAFGIFDEPFSGLDPINQDLFLDVFAELRAAGTTIVLSAHQMQLVERAADRILLVHRGREVLSGTLDEIRRRAGAASLHDIYVRAVGEAASGEVGR